MQENYFPKLFAIKTLGKTKVDQTILYAVFHILREKEPAGCYRQKIKLLFLKLCAIELEVKNNRLLIRFWIEHKECHSDLAFVYHQVFESASASITEKILLFLLESQNFTSQKKVFRWNI